MLTVKQIEDARGDILRVNEDGPLKSTEKVFDELAVAYERVTALLDKWKAGCSDIDYYAGSSNPDADRREKNMTAELRRALEG